MTTSQRPRRHRIAAAALLVTASATTAGMLLAAAPANADDKFVAISFSPENGAYGWGNNYDSQDGARIRSLTECQNYGGTHCVFIAWAQNGCAALAVGDKNPYGGFDQYYGWYGPTLAAAEQQALDKNGGGHVLVSRCATGGQGTG
jgi:Domain of unknown function (DUF4189)